MAVRASIILDYLNHYISIMTSQVYYINRIAYHKKL